MVKIIYYGKGEGKTTAAIGHALRSSYYGKVTIIQFMKGSTSGEIEKIKELDNVEHYTYGLNEFLHKENYQLHKQQAELALNKFRELNPDEHSLIILDEILYALEYELLSEDAILELMDKTNTNLILTGRNTTKKISEKADTVTEMKEIKHYFQKNKKSVKGIEY